MQLRAKRKRENKLAQYAPYTKQLEFHAAGVDHDERALIAGNQLGKTLSVGAEVACHLTGRYPNWWNGHVFKRPVVGWVAGETAEATRDNPQRMLMGRFNALGTGMLPADSIKSFTRRRGVADAIDTVVVRWGGGGDVQAGESLTGFKSYDQGRTKFQGETLDFGWCDEEPPIDVYSEFLTRLNASEKGRSGLMMASFTPLKGISAVVYRYMREKVAGSMFVQMGIDDVDHYTAEQKIKIVAKYLAHERDARAKGIPLLGSGAVFPVLDSLVEYDAFPLPASWPRLVAMDFGWEHPTAIVWLAWDRDTDTVYVYDCYRVKEQPVAIHAAVIVAKGKWMPVAWPHDGLNDTAVGPQLAKQYRAAGVDMLPEHSQYETVPGDADENTKRARNSVEAGVSDMLTRMQTGRLKVAKHLADWYEEKRGYHRKDGKIVKLIDDLLCATRYGIMSLRFAKTDVAVGKLDHNRKVSWR